MMDAHDLALTALAEHPRYRRLVRRRGRLAWILTATMLAVYFGFVLLVAFARSWLAQPLAGGATTIGFPRGLAVILVAVGLTGVYVRRAAREFDAEVARLQSEFPA
jgi:uncharacterized membrane protein (DUF485 family)